MKVGLGCAREVVGGLLRCKGRGVLWRCGTVRGGRYDCFFVCIDVVRHSSRVVVVHRRTVVRVVVGA